MEFQCEYPQDFSGKGRLLKTLSVLLLSAACCSAQ